DFERHGGAERVGREGRVCGPRWKDGRRDEILTRPDTAERIEPVRQGFPENDDVWSDAEIFEAPQLTRAVEAHLNFVVHHQDVAIVQNLPETLEITGRRDHIAAGPLNRFDVERRKLGLAGLRIPEGVVLRVKAALELLQAIQVAVVDSLVV